MCGFKQVNLQGGIIVYRKVFIILAMLLCIFQAQAILAAEGPNLIANPGAEYNMKGQNVPDYWRGSTRVTYDVVDKTEFNSGSASFKIEALNSSDTYLLYSQTRVILNPGTKIKVGVAYKASNFAPGQSNKIKIVPYRVDQNNASHWLYTSYSLDCYANDWKNFESPIITVPSDWGSDPFPIYIQLQVSGAVGDGGQNAKVWFDDIFIKVVEGSDDSIPPNKPNEVMASKRLDDNVELTWEPPTKASDGDLPILYKVYRSDLSGFTPNTDNLIYEVPVYMEGVPPTSPSTYVTSFIDTSAGENRKYYYRIAAVDKMGNPSYSDEVAASERAGFGNNLVKNGSFEGWDGSKFDDWSITSNITASDVKKGGNYSLKISNSTPVYSYAIQTVKLEKDTDYTIVCWIKGENIVEGSDPQGNPGAGVRIFYAIGNTTNFTGTFDWKYITKSFNSGDKESLDFFLYMHYATGVVYFDGFGVYKTADIDGVPPEKPKILTYEPINGEQKVVLKWEASGPAPDGDLPVKYRIYHGSSPTSMTVLAELSASVTSWTHENALGDSGNYYYITALDKARNESDPSNIIFLDKRSKVSGKVVTISEDGEIENLSGVKLSIMGTELSTMSQNGLFEFRWLVGGEYTLIVQKEMFRQKREPLTIVTGEDIVLDDIELELDDIPPNEPKNLTIDDSHVGVIILEWDRPDMAVDFEYADAYNIYRSTTGDINRKVQKPIATVAETIYFDIGTEEDFEVEYYYIIEAVDLAGNPSILGSNIESATMKTPPVPNPVSPKNRELFSEEAPTFQWQMPSNPDIEGFLIQISHDPSFPKAKTLTEDCPELNFTWPEKLEQALWYWRIKACFNTGSESAWSTTNEFVTISDSSTAIVPYINVVPSIFENDSVTIGYYLAKEADIRLRVFNIEGKLVSNLKSSRETDGFYEVVWSGRDLREEELPNGLYIIQLVVNSDEGKPEKILKKVVIYR